MVNTLTLNEKKKRGEFKECQTHPSPVRAQQAWMCHGCLVMVLSVRNSEISPAVMEPFTSCLLARMRIDAFSRSCEIQGAEGYPWCRRKREVLKEKRMSQRDVWERRTICSVRRQHADACSAKFRHRGFVRCRNKPAPFRDKRMASANNNTTRFYVPRVAAFCAAPLCWWWDVHGQCCPPPGWRSKKKKKKQATVSECITY